MTPTNPKKSCEHKALRVTKWLTCIRCVYCGKYWEKTRTPSGTVWTRPWNSTPKKGKEDASKH